MAPETLFSHVPDPFILVLEQPGEQLDHRLVADTAEKLRLDEGDEMGLFRSRKRKQASGNIEFDADGKVTKIDVPAGNWAVQQSGQSRYYTQHADSLLHATELLKAVSSVPGLTYYVVDTPDGALGRDTFGFYTEAPIKTKGFNLVTSVPVPNTVEAVSLTAYGDPMQSQLSVAALKQQGQYANFILLIECGRCGYKSPVETKAGAMERECYCCGARNKTSRGSITVHVGSNMVDI